MSQPSPAPPLTPRVVKAHDDLVRVHPLGLTHLTAREGGPESRTEEIQHTLNHRECRGEQSFVEKRSGGLDSFVEWVQHRPKNARKKYRPTSQGAWVRKQEFQAKAALKKPA